MAELISFYSFKGGVGRSLLLANVAAILAGQGRRVACVDFDLEAAGLHTIFGLPAGEIELSLLDVLNPLSHLSVERCIVDLSDRLLSRRDGGKLWLVPAISDASKLSMIFKHGRDISMLLSEVIHQVEDRFNPHLILVDTRTGFSELAAAGILRAERLICVLRPSRQNVEGLRILFDILDSLPVAPEVLTIVSQVPDLPKAEEKLRFLEESLGSGRVFDIAIPFLPQLALDEAVVSMSPNLKHLESHFLNISGWLGRSEYA